MGRRRRALNTGRPSCGMTRHRGRVAARRVPLEAFTLPLLQCLGRHASTVPPRLLPLSIRTANQASGLDEAFSVRQVARVPTNTSLYRLAAAEEKNNVSGLLLLFCLTRTIISPVYLLIQYYMTFSVLGGVGRVFAVAPWLFILAVGDALLTALGMWAGILIWKLRAVGVRLAKWYLVLTFIYPLLLGLLLQKLGMGALAEAFGTSLGTSLVFSTLWFIYLCRSENVRNICEADKDRNAEPV